MLSWGRDQVGAYNSELLLARSRHLARSKQRNRSAPAKSATLSRPPTNQFAIYRLDSLFDTRWSSEALAFAHLDVDGLELSVLEGGERTILRDRPILTIELEVWKDATRTKRLLAMLTELLKYEIWVSTGRWPIESRAAAPPSSPCSAPSISSRPLVLASTLPPISALSPPCGIKARRGSGRLPTGYTEPAGLPAREHPRTRGREAVEAVVRLGHGGSFASPLGSDQRDYRAPRLPLLCSRRRVLPAGTARCGVLLAEARARVAGALHWRGRPRLAVLHPLAVVQQRAVHKAPTRSCRVRQAAAAADAPAGGPGWL